MLKPDQTVMTQMVSHLFADQMRGLVELCWTDPMQGAPRHAQLFSLDAIDEMIEKAAALNIEQRNVYIGAALRRESTAPFSRTSSEDFFAATAIWADLDDPGITARAAEICRRLDLRPTFVVFTGRYPHERAQAWWRLDEPVADAERIKTLLARISHSG